MALYVQLAVVMALGWAAANFGGYAVQWFGYDVPAFAGGDEARSVCVGRGQPRRPDPTDGVLAVGAAICHLDPAPPA